MDVYRGILSHEPYIKNEALTVVITGGLTSGSHFTAWWKWTEKPTNETASDLAVYSGVLDEEPAADSAERQFSCKGTYGISLVANSSGISVTLEDSQGNLGSFNQTVLQLAYSFPVDEESSPSGLFVGLTPKLPHFEEPYLIAVLVPEDLKSGAPAVILWHENHSKSVPAANRLVKFELEIADVDHSHGFQDVALGPHFHLRSGDDVFNAIIHEGDSSLKFRIGSADSDLPEADQWASLQRYPLTA